MDRNYRGIDGNFREIDLIRGSHPKEKYFERERERERDALSNELVYSSMMEMWLQVFIEP